VFSLIDAITSFCTDLLGSNNEPRAMPLAEFIEETISVLGTDAHEVLVERAKPLRNNPGPNEGAFVTEFNAKFDDLRGTGACVALKGLQKDRLP
jgi:hypothetical protein